MKNKYTEKEAEITLNSLDRLQQVPANEFLYGRVLHRLAHAENNNAGGYTKLITRLSLAFLVLASVNIATYSVIAKNNAQQISTGINAFASAYGMQKNTYSYY